MRAYCPYCLNIISNKEVNRAAQMVHCDNCGQQTTLKAVENFSLLQTNFEHNLLTPEQKKDFLGYYPLLPEHSTLKVEVWAENGETTLTLTYKPCKLWVTILIILGLIGELIYVISHIDIILSLKMNFMSILPFIIFGFLMIQYLLGFFVPETIVVQRGKMTHTSRWKISKSYFAEEIEYVFHDVVVTKNKNGEARTDVLVFTFLGKEETKTVFANIPENEARWAAVIIKKYLEETGIGHN